MISRECKKRRAVSPNTGLISGEPPRPSTDSEVGEINSQESEVTSNSIFEHQSFPKSMAESMNVSKTRLCGKILKKLMDHKGGWLFHKPVDPVLYGIPDYFDVIRNPMDLGTVHMKLSNKQYVTASEFAADVRLTFTNAMKYNPPGNDVHAVAEQLNRIFDSEWRSVIRKWNIRNPVQEQKPMKATKPQAAMKSKSLIAKGLVTCSNSLAKESSINAISSKVKIKFFVRGSENTSLKAGSQECSIDSSLASTKENDKISRIQSNENRVLSNGNESVSCNSLASSEQGEESYVHLEPLSPSKALRIAMLKSRFAGTIVKAQQNALLDHGKEVDIAKLQLEKERLEKRQQEGRKCSDGCMCLICYLCQVWSIQLCLCIHEELSLVLFLFNTIVWVIRLLVNLLFYELAILLNILNFSLH